MKEFIYLIYLNCKKLCGKGVILALAILLPMLIVFLTGTARVQSQISDIRGALVDRAKNAASKNLVAALKKSEISWFEMSEEEATSQLLHNKVDCRVILPENYGKNGKNSYRVEFTSGQNELLASVAMEQVLLLNVSFGGKEMILEQLTDIAAAHKILDKDQKEAGEGTELTPAKIREKFFAYAAYGAAHGCAIDLSFVNESAVKTQSILLIPEFGVELLLLSFLTVLALLKLYDDLPERLYTVQGAVYKYRAAALIAVFCYVMLQVLAMFVVYKFFLPGYRLTPGFLPGACLFVLFHLGVAVFLRQIKTAVRPAFSIVLLLLLALLGGVFVKLPEKMYEVSLFFPGGYIQNYFNTGELSLRILPFCLLTVILCNVSHFARMIKLRK